MLPNEFVGQVQHSARLADLDQALNATRATLETLAKRLSADYVRLFAATRRKPRHFGAGF